jgi:hypothetical protein
LFIARLLRDLYFQDLLKLATDKGFKGQVRHPPSPQKFGFHLKPAQLQRVFCSNSPYDERLCNFSTFSSSFNR